ncbi:MAG: hypothetical protein AAGD47_01845 [Pseudomonadota bacterium]
MPNFSAILPISGAFTLDREALIGQLREIMGPEGPEISLDPIGTRGGPVGEAWLSFGTQANESLMFSIGGIRILVGHDLRAYEDAEGLEAYCNPVFWPDGIAEPAEDASFISVVELSDTATPHPDEVFDRAVAVTITAAAVAALKEPDLVLWKLAQNALPPAMFRGLVEDLLHGAPPLLLWAHWAVVPTSREGFEPGIATSGLAPLIGRDILAPPSHVPQARMLELVFRLANRMISWEDKPGDGDLIGEEPVCRVRHRRQSIFSRTPYFELRPLEEGAPGGVD